MCGRFAAARSRLGQGQELFFRRGSGMSRLIGRISCFAAGLIITSLYATNAWAVAANPLQNAYWRFEEGPANSFVNHSAIDPVKDSINSNHLDAFSASS